ncbi:YceI family protein [Amycolatopsis acidicola]|uniref:YceI family protein n=1 Tax=Amycolatopsis acidicola TaxID=2596893 RepID=A0A5N0VKY9_9PSEU|nr:YceI family protein [Amycolatopsis acidicola]KAA9166846.1 YceI family protein [Amycolatopsis acidicola]
MDATAELAVEPFEKLPLPGGYDVGPRRFVLEPAVRVLRWPVLRGRLACTAGSLVLGDQPGLMLELDAGSLRTNVFGLARTLTDKGGLCAAEHPRIRFHSTDMSVAEDWSVEVIGKIEVLDVVREVRLRGELAHVDELAVVLWLRGVLPPPRRQLETGYWVAQVIAERPIHLELAAEFVR